MGCKKILRMSWGLSYSHQAKMKGRTFQAEDEREGLNGSEEGESFSYLRNLKVTSGTRNSVIQGKVV